MSNDDKLYEQAFAKASECLVRLRDRERESIKAAGILGMCQAEERKARDEYNEWRERVHKLLPNVLPPTDKP